MKKKKIVVAYSGGLDTSVMVKWLSQKYDAEIITVTGNLGQKKDLENLEEKALKTGASKAYIVNLQNEFIEDYAWKALKAGALYEGEYPLATAIGRPLLAKLMVEIAQKESADMIAHGCTGKGNDQVRFEVGIKTLAPDMEILAPLRTWEFKTREEEIDYALQCNIPISITKQKPYSIDENLWGIAVECGELEDTRNPPPEDAYQITKNPVEAKNKPEQVTLTFEKGIPVAIEGQKYSGAELVAYLNSFGGEHGIGRIDMVENRVVGIKSREIYEAPGAVILLKAHHELEKLTLDKDTFRYKQNVSNQISNMIYDGLWFSPLFNSLMTFVDSTQENVSGEIKLQLYKGNITILSRTSPFSLYNKKLATYGAGDTFSHQDSAGFINIVGLPFKTISKVSQKNKLVLNENIVGQ
ncbi:MAG TPA: argininosuccinate synthase [Ignavibacteriaceae bacterium]|nr:MAG: argininosuccinate synthase [Ignavibacteria bacterium RBG_16_35_7]